MANDIFISYSRKDVAFARALEEKLNGAGLSVWRDETRLAPAGVFTTEIASALRRARRVLVVWSAESATSDWVLDEARFACGHCKMLSIRIDNARPPNPFSQVNAIRVQDLRADFDKIISLFHAAPEPMQANIFGLPQLFDQKANNFFVVDHLIGRTEELTSLQRAWNSGIALRDEVPEKLGAPPGKHNVMIFHAMGGAGKTALITTYYRLMERGGWMGAEAVYVWSFYSQGTDEQRQGSTDEFFFHALNWFGYKGNISNLSPNRRALELAKLVASRRTLLVLDGIEPLQWPTTQGRLIAGSLKDTALRELLTYLCPLIRFEAEKRC